MPRFSPPLLPKGQMESYRYILYGISKSPFSSAFRDLTWFRGISTTRISEQLAHADINRESGFLESHAPVPLEAMEGVPFPPLPSALPLSPLGHVSPAIQCLCMPSVPPSFTKMGLLVFYLIFLVAFGKFSGRKRGNANFTSSYLHQMFCGNVSFKQELLNVILL